MTFLTGFIIGGLVATAVCVVCFTGFLMYFLDDMFKPFGGGR